MARNWYSEAIVIVNEDHNFKNIVIEIAKKHPKMVVDAAACASGKSWQQICKSLRDGQGLLHAVKECRALTGMGLKEAMEACEAL